MSDLMEGGALAAREGLQQEIAQLKEQLEKVWLHLLDDHHCNCEDI